ncbi:MAG: hypothetical protein AB7V32_07820 [Candidatus Berkiella sp.]
MIHSNQNDDSKSPKKQPKLVHFDMILNTEHVVDTFYPKGNKKPGQELNAQTRIPVDIKQKKKVKKYLENYDEKYKGFILSQYRNNQDGTYAISFIDPESKDHFTQTFMQERIDEIIDEMIKIKGSKPK